jgi:carbon dioxide concentrating mechanism protein CcmN
MTNPSLTAIVLSRTITEVEVLPSYLYGDVTIDPSAAIAPGVLLQAEPHSRIVIGAGVCIGLGTIVHAAGGVLDIQAGVCLSSELLIVGAGKIGERACIGAGTTIIDPDILPGTIISPDSLIGDRSRQVDLTTRSTEYPTVPDPFDDEVLPEIDLNTAPTIPVEEVVEVTVTTTKSVKSVAGKNQFERLKRKLFT